MNQDELTVSFQTDGVAVVTGAAQGIGQAAAVALAQQGADVACVDRDADRCAETVALVEGLGRKALAIGCDVSSRAEVDAAADRIVAELGPITYLATCAGVLTENVTAEEVKDEDEWLDNQQSASVMKQYEEAYPWFRFMGALPIDFSAPDPYVQDKTQTRCLHPDMCSLDLHKVYKEGVRGIGIVFNLDPHFKGGSHWVGLYIDIHDIERPAVSFSDSYGFKPPRLIARFMRALRLQTPQATLGYNARRFQFSDTECGMYSMYFIICMIQGIPFKAFCKDSVPDRFMLALRAVLFSK